jgi:hypothetical protein
MDVYVAVHSYHVPDKIMELKWIKQKAKGDFGGGNFQLGKALHLINLDLGILKPYNSQDQLMIRCGQYPATKKKFSAAWGYGHLRLSWIKPNT